ncbi:cation-transporting ATPase [Hyphomicrobium denitrificans 1NES1]|uniref:Cation-transporting ATPase n=1 Tax=Hyphomicrobium denitrificans 1NES1 TaxID=670307 RepID=N0B9N7_9HYPH|nr:cation-transporting ATPase [Hyphomicrobium denitrificans 1NES1]
MRSRRHSHAGNPAADAPASAGSSIASQSGNVRRAVIDPDFAVEARGLTTAEAGRRLAEIGPNRIPARDRESLWSELLESLREPLVLLLLAVGSLYAVFGELHDALIVFGVIGLVALTEAAIEWRAGRAVAALSALAEPKVLVWRDGALADIPIEALVPGDLIELRAGSRVPADARLVESQDLAADESLVTGESEPVPRGAGDPESVALLAGTAIVRGAGRAVVTATGAASTLGRIAGLVAETKQPKTPLQLRMGELARTLLWAAIGVSVLIPLIGIAAGQSPKEMLLTGLSLAFATIPEELPVLIVVVLGLGSLRLARRGAIVRRLVAAETLGAVTVVCTDKTGTLTENRMALTDTIPAVTLAGHRATPPETIDRVLCSAALASEPAMIDPIDRAIRSAAEGHGITRATEQHFPFDQTRRLASGYAAVADGRVEIGIKGAPEAVLERCSAWRDGDGVRPLDEPMRATFLRAAAERGRGGRILAIASRMLAAQPPSRDVSETELVLEGLVVLRDPVRAAVPAAMAALGSAGISVSIITGDQPSTALTVAAEAGIRHAHILTGAELQGLDANTLARRTADGAIVARAEPADKLRIVSALTEAGEVVMVTGDGVNDAPALRAAAVGVAMGRVGSDVARQAAQVVLTDDSFATLVEAVREGRRLYDNFRKAIRYYLAVKVALVLASAAAAILGLPLPFTPVQIVVLELFMDLGASLAFVGQPAEPDVMCRPPRDPDARFFDHGMVLGLLAGGVTLAAIVFASFWIGLDRFGLSGARTVALVTWMIGHAALGLAMAGGVRNPVSLLRNGVLLMWIGAAFLFAAGLLWFAPLRDALHGAAVSLDIVAICAGLAALVPLWTAALGPPQPPAARNLTASRPAPTSSQELP